MLSSIYYTPTLVNIRTELMELSPWHYGHLLALPLFVCIYVCLCSLRFSSSLASLVTESVAYYYQTYSRHIISTLNIGRDTSAGSNVEWSQSAAGRECNNLQYYRACASDVECGGLPRESIPLAGYGHERGGWAVLAKTHSIALNSIALCIE